MALECFMYLEHFGLHRHPFRITPEDDFIYMSQQHSRAYVYMSSAIWSSEGFVAISGEVGSGKTTLLRKTIRSLEGNLKLLHISYTKVDSQGLFSLIVKQAGLEPENDTKTALLFSIMDYLQKMAEQGTPVVLAVDEAQNLTRDNLEDIRMLAGLENLGGPSMRVILLGQPELKDHITAIPQLAQRVKLFFHLEGLSLKEVSEYIDYRLLVAGHGGNRLFDEGTVKDIYELSQGIPRLINKICDAMMLCAYSEDRPFIDPNDLREIRHEVLGEETPSQKKKRGQTKAKTPAAQPMPVEPGQGLSNDALGRIAAALEGIDHKLGELLMRQAESGQQDGGETVEDALSAYGTSAPLGLETLFRYKK